ncbi:hypothetical protein GGX14DRAFT_608254 [Mycena pura]|uniref:Uncharacterized protein n=1 Tax=Mycena pura TaxID=153505 RepID=A0AAD6YJH6_9AGAR|nr:hypothetical protein GGX14DRAFT_608254 [Mycena pura]
MLLVNKTPSDRHSIAIHLALLAIWDKHLERQLIFSSSLNTRKIVSFSITAILTSFSFNSSQSVPVATQSFPEFNSSVYDSSTADLTTNVFMYQYARNLLSSLQSALQSATAVGLFGGTLYDVLEPNLGKGNVTVNTIGFNVTCSYLTDFNLEFRPETASWNVNSTNGSQFAVLEPTDRGIISGLDLNPSMRGVFLYSTAQIVDSSGDAAFQTELSPSPTDGQVYAHFLLVPNRSSANKQWWTRSRTS